MSEQPLPRDQALTPFSSILQWFCRASGASCAALVDPEGETVDYGGVGDPYDIRILAAELRLLQQRLAEAPHLSQADQFMVRGQRKTFLLQALPEGYALAAQLPQGISEPSQRAVAVASERLSQEAGFRTGNTDVLRCRELAVEEACGGTHRPEAVSVDGEWQPLFVLGRLATADLSEDEMGFRVRLLSGQEGNLVREALGYWYLEGET